MPDKLLTAEEVADLLGISEEEMKKLVKNGDLPAYKIGGRYLRFRKEQVEAMRSEILLVANDALPAPAAAREHHGKPHEVWYPQSPLDKILDFVYFYDFYLISISVITVILWFILKLQ